MAEQLAENYHNTWGRKKKLELEAKGENPRGSPQPPWAPPTCPLPTLRAPTVCPPSAPDGHPVGPTPSWRHLHGCCWHLLQGLSFPLHLPWVLLPWVPRSSRPTHGC